GICFVGKVGIKDFLLNELGPQKPGKIIDKSGKIIGQHEGVIFYTIGQRHGLDVGGGLPYYVSSKDMGKNEVYVTTDLNDKNLWHKELKLTDMHWIDPNYKLPTTNYQLQVRTRHRAPLLDAKLEKKGRTLLVKLKDETRAATPGQSAVIYEKDLVLGGGIIT
ncbi:MAG: tRNA methyl transferase PRC-barrel domain-containing protein, partial [Minisyncoccia bacterium]